MIPTTTCQHCHGTSIEPHTLDLPEEMQTPCKVCHGEGERVVLMVKYIRQWVNDERISRRLEAA